MSKVLLLIALVVVAFIGGSYLIGNNEPKEPKVETVEPAKTEVKTEPQQAPQTADQHKELELQKSEPLPAVNKEEAAQQAKNAEPTVNPSEKQSLPEEQSLEGHQQQQPADLPEANKSAAPPKAKILANEQKPEAHAKTLEHNPTSASTGVAPEAKPDVQQTTPEELSKAVGQKEPAPHKEQALPEEQSLEGHREQKAAQQPETNQEASNSKLMATESTNQVQPQEQSSGDKPVEQQKTPEQQSKEVGQEEPAPHKEQALPEEQSLEGNREQKAEQQPEANKQ